MYLTVGETADYLDISVSEVYRLINERQIRFLNVDDTILINRAQFALFLKARQKAIQAYEEHLNTPLPEDCDVKDED